jgi:leader peptidase (prepilin peptidase) / N-methyltransferase
MTEPGSTAEGATVKRNLPGFRGIVLAVVVAVAVALRYRASATGIVVSFAALALVLLSAVDLEQRRVPNVIVLPAAALVLAGRVATDDHRAWIWPAAAFGTAFAFFVLAAIYPAGLGMGDVKLALLIGATLGGDVIAGLLLGTVAAGLAAIALFVRYGSKARGRTLAYAPFLSFGALAVILVLRP